MSEGAWDKMLAALADAGLEYTDLHRVQAAFFSANGCGVDSDCLADETLDRLARQLAAGARIRNFVSYTRGIARHVYSKYCKNRIEFIKALQEMEYLGASRMQETEERPDLRSRCQKSCLKKRLSDSERQLMVDYLLNGKSRAEMAEERGWSKEKFSSRIHQLKVRLEKCVKECRKRA